MFEHIFYINLDKDVDRRKLCENQLNYYGLNAERFSAICPTDKGNFPTIGARGCYLSHLKLVEEAKRRNLDHILILEDDFLLHEKFFELCSQLSPVEYDLFYFYRWSELDEYPIKIVPIEYTICTHAYAVHSNYYDKYIEQVKNHEDGKPIDLTYFISDKKFAPSVNLIGQNAVTSSITLPNNEEQKISFGNHPDRFLPNNFLYSL